MLSKRETPQSIEWHEPEQCEEIIEAQPYDYANQPDDLPSVDHWYKVRDAHIFQQERMANG
jgi:hypothetical protein